MSNKKQEEKKAVKPPSKDGPKGSGAEGDPKGGDFQKVLVLGDSGVGKSCMIVRFMDDNFTASFLTTVGVDFRLKPVDVEGKKINLQVWDTAGQERFQSITTAYYRGTTGVLLLYDTTDESSFQNIRVWLRKLEEHAGSGDKDKDKDKEKAPKVSKILVGTKADMIGDKVVDFTRAQSLAEEFGFPLFETSAKTGANITAAFTCLAKNMLEEIQKNPPVKPDVIKVGGDGDGSSSRCSC